MKRKRNSPQSEGLQGLLTKIKRMETRQILQNLGFRADNIKPSNEAENDRPGTSVFITDCGLAVLLLFVALISNKHVGTVPPTTPPVLLETQQSKPMSPWSVSASQNQLTGERELTVINGSHDSSIVIRKRGSNLDCYVTTGEFLGTVENMDSHQSLVQYKFDDGSIVRQEWIISNDNTALFYPGNPIGFLRKMVKAKRFVIEFRPSDTIPQTKSFHVSQFPPEVVAVLDSIADEMAKEARTAKAQEAALRADAEAHVHPCTISGNEDWCWTEETGKESIWLTKQSAINPYMTSHR